MDIGKIIKIYPYLMDKNSSRIIREIERSREINLMQLHLKTGISYTQIRRSASILLKKRVLTKYQKKKKRGSPVLLKLRVKR